MPSPSPSPRLMRVRVLVAMLVAGASLGGTSQAATASAAPDVVADANWILESTFPDGAIAHYHDRVAIRPYFSHFAAIGLLQAYTATLDERYADGAWSWLSWYQTHMDANGYVHDYDLVNGVLTSTGDMDSTDAYAGMFLVAAYNAHRTTSDASKTMALRVGIVKAVGAIESMMQEDGLTWAKPDWHVKYLMDQAEAYAGLRSAAWLATNVLDDSVLAARAAGDADRIQAGVAALWNEATGAYDWAKHEDGARQPTNWANLYPDALQQVWAVAFGLVDDNPSRANLLLDRFSATHPNWDQPTADDQLEGVTKAVGYWPVAAWAFGRQGDHARANQAIEHIRAAAIADGRGWPFTTAVAGQLLSLQAMSLDLLPSTSEPETAQTPTAVDIQPATRPRLSVHWNALRRVLGSWMSR